MGLLFLYLALMSGHFVSIDGLVMWRQSLSLVLNHSFNFVPPIWWGGYAYTSSRGVGASLEYLPSILAFGWLPPYTPVPGATYDFGLFFRDRLYEVAGAPVWSVVTAATALVVGLTTRTLGLERRAALWAIAFFGLGSPALLGARGDFPQPLVGLCWVTGIYACQQLRKGGSDRWLWLCGVSVAYAVLTRPLEGSMLLPAVLLLLVRDWRTRPERLVIPIASWVGALVVTLLINWIRFGAALNFGYSGISWNVPIWVGFPYALLSPGRGALWQFPAMVLAVLGSAFLWRNGKRLEMIVLAGLPAVLFIESCVYFAWIDGWDWGFRLFQPALPIVAVIAGAGAVQLRGRLGVWLPSALLAGGVVWNIPAVATNLLGGYAATYDNLASWSRLDAYPPIGAWQFLHHIRATRAGDTAAVDIVWFRTASATHWFSLIPFALLLVSAAALWVRAVAADRMPFEMSSERHSQIRN
jgi:4-amino-4-deoxy-L-arabinose transferase-like glycosyltransferase